VATTREAFLGSFQLFKSNSKRLSTLPARSNIGVAPVGTDFPKYNVADPVASFEEVGDALLKMTMSDLPDLMPDSEKRWVQDMLECNVKGGKMNRGLLVVESGAEVLKAQGRPATSEQLSQLAVLGWCMEWMQAWMLMADDVMDESETRRGQPCWYKREEVGMVAVNDALLLESLVYRVLERFFRHEHYYPKLVKIVQEAIYNTELGQLADARSSSLPWEDFTVGRFEWISEYKTAFYSFYCPVAVGMIFAGIEDDSVFEAAKKVLIKMGIYFQAQDDHLDCFAPPEELGKIGTDIQDGKCSWVFAHAFNAASSEQKGILKKHYGNCKAGSDEEQIVKKVYRDLKMEEQYKKYATDCFDEITGRRPDIEAAGLPWSIFESFLMKIHGRRK